MCYSPADSADDAEECSKLHYYAENCILKLLRDVCLNLRENYPNNPYIPLALLAIYTPERMRALPIYAMVVIGSFRKRALTITVVIGLR